MGGSSGDFFKTIVDVTTGGILGLTKQKKSDGGSDIAAANAKAVADAQAAQANAGAQAAASVDEKRKAIARSRSVYTSPLGLGTQATTARKSLLGQ